MVAAVGLLEMYLGLGGLDRGLCMSGSPAVHGLFFVHGDKGEILCPSSNLPFLCYSSNKCLLLGVTSK